MRTRRKVFVLGFQNFQSRRRGGKRGASATDWEAVEPETAFSLLARFQRARTNGSRQLQRIPPPTQGRHDTGMFRRLMMMANTVRQMISPFPTNCEACQPPRQERSGCSGQS